ncbi:MAG: sigma 54-interacting transcriptional regulator [Acidobacteriota bacterium]
MSERRNPSWVLQLRSLPEAEDAPEAAASERVFSLRQGLNRVGSDAANDLPLRGRGASRFHAVIRCEADGCRVEDLGSKNGTRVNGRRVKEEGLESGDVVAFGASRWWLDRQPVADVELALDFGADLEAPDEGREATALEITRTLEPHGASAGLPPATLAALLGRLSQHPTPDWEGALLEIAGQLGAAGACWLEGAEGERVSVVAAVGRVEEILGTDDLAESQPLSDLPNLSWSTLGGGSGLLVSRNSAADRAESQGWGPGLALFGLARRAAGSADPQLGAPPWRGELALAASCLLLMEAFETPSAGGAGDPAAETRKLPGLKLPAEIVVSSSGPMSSVYAQVAEIADDSVPVLITGETGSGKEHLARALHDSSRRGGGPFVAVNCSAIPAELLEAEMFGIGQGVATGVKARLGRIREADGGTLFLDEIGDMPLPLQTKLLRVLQDGEVTPVGGAPFKVELRLVSASHADFQEAIEARRFRSDLFYRLAGYVLRVPALRERRDDLPLLLSSFLRRISAETGRQVHGVTVKALEAVLSSPWPGNVRQLEHAARRLVYLCPQGQAVTSAMVHDALGMLSLPAAREGSFALGSEGLKEHLSEIEARILRQALESTGNNRSRAAELLRISRNSLARRLERLGLEPGRS